MDGKLISLTSFWNIRGSRGADGTQVAQALNSSKSSLTFPQHFYALLAYPCLVESISVLLRREQFHSSDVARAVEKLTRVTQHKRAIFTFNYRWMWTPLIRHSAGRAAQGAYANKTQST